MTTGDSPLDISADWLCGHPPPAGMTPAEHSADITRKLDALDELADAHQLPAGAIDMATVPMLMMMLRTDPPSDPARKPQEGRRGDSGPAAPPTSA